MSIEKFSRENSDSGWYSNGGCYEFALAIGRVITSLGDTPQYYEYGSNSEPFVHVAVGCNGKFYDINGEFDSLDKLSDYGDFYFDSKSRQRWVSIKDSDIPTHRSNVEAIYFEILKQAR